MQKILKNQQILYKGKWHLLLGSDDVECLLKMFPDTQSFDCDGAELHVYIDGGTVYVQEIPYPLADKEGFKEFLVEWIDMSEYMGTIDEKIKKLQKESHNLRRRLNG